MAHVSCIKMTWGPFGLFVPCDKPGKDCPQRDNGPGHGSIDVWNGVTVEVDSPERYREKRRERRGRDAW